MKKFFRSVTSLILTGVLLLNNSIAVYADEKTKDEIREIVYEALLGEDITNAEIAFDENYKIKSVKNAIGNYAYYQYDDEGINIIRNEKLDTRLTVDESGNIVKYENFVNGAEAEYSYDDENNLIGIYNDDYSYEIDKDDSGVPLELSRNGEMLFRTELEDEKPVSKEFGNGQEVLYNYNDSGLIQSIESDGNILFSFKYDKDGFVEEISNNKTDTSINYAYVDNNVITEYDNGTEIITSYNDIENATEKEIATLIDDYNINLKYDNEDVLNELSTGKSEFQYEYEQIGSYKKITNDFGTFEEELEPNYEDGILTGYKFVSGDDVYYCILDEDGFISEIELNDDLIYSFEYDNKFGQLIEYVDYITGRIYTFDYDDTGNIIYKSLECNDVVEETEYEYNNLRWQDQLTEYDDVEIKYDYIGNITQFGDASLKWTQGNLLSSYSDEDNDIKYYYDENGVRVGKTVNGEETTYIADGYQVIVENVEDHELVYIYIYDKLLGFYFDGNIYYYKTNPLGDIIGIYNEEFELVVEYKYDIWGNILEISGDEADTVGKYNPYRYRGYRYDEETNLYYLYSRYYSPELARFISADCYVSEPGGSILLNNLYVYCLNNPANYIDPYGYSATVVAVGTWGTIAIGAFILSLISLIEVEGYCDELSDYLDDLLDDLGRRAKEYIEEFADAITNAASKANEKTYRHPTNDHHIVAKSASRADEARGVYRRKFGDGQLDNSRNLVTIRTSLHTHLHSNIYYDSVNDLMIEAETNNTVASTLRSIKNSLKIISNVCP